MRSNLKTKVYYILKLYLKLNYIILKLTFKKLCDYRNSKVEHPLKSLYNKLVMITIVCLMLFSY